MEFNIVKVFKECGVWLVYIDLIPQYCGCSLSRRILQFDQESEPTEEEIKQKYESNN